MLVISTTLFSHLHLCLPSGLFHSGLPTKTLYAPLLRLLFYYAVTSFCKNNVACPSMRDVKAETVEHSLKVSNRRHVSNCLTHKQNFIQSGYAWL
jgi:hypothetical protein